MKKAIPMKTVSILGTFISWILWGMFLPNIQEFRPLIESPFAKTSLRIQLCYFYLNALDEETRNAFFKEVRSCRNPLCMNRIMKKYLVQAMMALGDNPSIAEEKIKKTFHMREGLCLDEWGHPLRVAVVGGPLDFRVFPKELKDLVIVIWSCGPNGIDEWGHGDDVFVKRPLFGLKNKDKKNMKNEQRGWNKN